MYLNAAREKYINKIPLSAASANIFCDEPPGMGEYLWELWAQNHSKQT